MTAGNHLYFTGEKCKRGHIAQRYTKTCVCTVCHKQNAEAQRQRIDSAMPNIRAISLRTHVDDHKALLAYATMLNAARGFSVQNDPVVLSQTRSGIVIPDTSTQEYKESAARAIAQTHANIFNRTAPTAPAYIPAEARTFVSPFQDKLDALDRHNAQLAADKLKRETN